MKRVGDPLDHDFRIGEQAGPKQNFDVGAFFGRRRQLCIRALLGAELLVRGPRSRKARQRGNRRPATFTLHRTGAGAALATTTAAHLGPHLLEHRTTLFLTHRLNIAAAGEFLHQFPSLRSLFSRHVGATALVP